MEAFMNEVIDAATLITILQEAAAAWSLHSDEIGRLDAVVGDGDMGITVELGCKAMTDCLANLAEEDIGKLLMKCGMQINKASPSTFGTLLASGFMEAGKAVLGRKEIGVKDLSLLGQGVINGIKKRGRAEVGEKTMIDSLVPAVEAFGQALTTGAETKTAVRVAIRAAKAGMEATVHMKAKYSRASYRQDGGIGVQDAGATAMYYLIATFGLSLAAHI
jgi:phosphoenolpyruvate---glycerone phosphotransferase subunit DhaL